MQIFEDVALDDMDQLAAAYSVGSIDLQNTQEVFALLKNTLEHSPSYPYFQSILCHMLSVQGMRREII